MTETSGDLLGLKLFIPIGNGKVVAGRDEGTQLVLPDASVSPRHAEIARRGDHFEISDLDSTHGTFVNNTRVKKRSVTPGDRIRFGPDICYDVRKDGLELVQRGMTIVAEDVEIREKGRPLLRNVGFRVEAEQFVGILGPSGVGKSILLECLAGWCRKRPDHGRIVFDGSKSAYDNLSQYLPFIGYVPQKDEFVPGLTVLETLETAGHLITDDRDEIRLKIEVAVEAVGLKGAMGTSVDKLSGGQKKRLAVAVALLRKPRLLLLDEPTAGLDPSTETKLMDQFKQCARRGTTVICTTHVLGNLDLFDGLLVLGAVPELHNGKHIEVGTLAFSGQVRDLFGALDLDRPDYSLLFERLHDLSVGLRDRPARVHSSPSSGAESSRADATTGEEGEVVVRYAARTVRTDGSTAAARRVLHQTAVLVRRTATALSRDRTFLALAIGQPLLLALLVCFSQFCLDPDSAAHRPTARIPFFYAILTALWLGMNNSAREFVRERKLYIRERIIGLDPASFFFSKAAFLMALGGLQIVLFVIVFRLFGQWTIFIPKAVEIFGRVPAAVLFALMLLTYSTGVAIGLIVSAKMRTQEAAVAILPLLIMPQLLLSEVGTSLLKTRDVQRVALRPIATGLRNAFYDLKNAAPTGTDTPERGVAAWFVDLASLAMPSRPATILTAPYLSVKSESAEGTDFLRSGPRDQIADALHLTALLIVYWWAAWWVYRRSERSWAADRRNWSE